MVPLVFLSEDFFFAKKGFEIIGIDNNARKKFFGKDGDISWVKKKIKHSPLYTLMVLQLLLLFVMNKIILTI